jgi:hypothetical protein
MTAEASRPLAIRRTALCLWFSAALALLVTVAQVLGLVPLAGATPGMTATIGVLGAGLLALIAVAVSARRGWGRWVFAVIYVLGNLIGVVLVLIMPEVFRAMPLVLQANMVVQFVLQTAALILMFSGTSAQWFRTRHAATAP